MYLKRTGETGALTTHRGDWCVPSPYGRERFMDQDTVSCVAEGCPTPNHIPI